MCHDALFPLPSLFVSGDVGLVGHRLAVVAAPYVVEEKVVEGRALSSGLPTSSRARGMIDLLAGDFNYQV